MAMMKKSSPKKIDDDTPRKRQNYTMEEKLGIIKESAAGKTKAQIAREKNMDETTVCSILGNIHIQGVPPISTQLGFQFLIFLIFLSKKTRFAIKTQMV